MIKARLAAHSRSQLDERFKELGPAKRYTRPSAAGSRLSGRGSACHGAAREAAGDQAPSLVRSNSQEAKGTIQLATLRRVAEAHCTLVYALLPNNRWKRRSATAAARSRVGVGPSRASMLLETRR